MVKIYLGAGLFNAGERLHNLYLEKYLIKLGYEVILPQREALKHVTDKWFNTVAIVGDCVKSCTNPAHISVICADGADVGAAVEYGMAIITTGRAVVFITDPRVDEKREVGINAMFKAEKTVIVCYPCFFTELNEVEAYYEALAMKIHEAICELS